MVLIQGSKADKIVETAKEYLRRLESSDFNYIWNEMLSHRAQRLVSYSVFPVALEKEGRLEDLLDGDILYGLAVGFQGDYEGQRTEFFEGMVGTYRNEDWFRLDNSDWLVFATDQGAIAINGSRDKTCLIPLVPRSTGDYAVDLEAFFLFAEVVSATKFSEMATRASIHEKQDVADLFSDLAKSLGDPYERLNDLVLGEKLIRDRITQARVEWLKAEGLFIRRVAAEGLAQPASSRAASLDPTVVKERFFKRYNASQDIEITEGDLLKLDLMGDSDLRKALAEVLQGVSKHDARRESRKSHGPAEIADMVLDVTIEGHSYKLCMPFKSGREIGLKKSVPIGVIYQIWRPHILLDNAVVVFITARPCTQNLRQDIHMSTSRKGWPIIVLEREELAALLKVNQKL